MVSRLRPAAFLFPALLLVACPSPEEAPPDPAMVDTIPTTVAPAPDDVRTVHVVMNEWSVSPQERTLAAGTVQFHVMNEGTRMHALTVERDGQQWTTGNIPAGGTGTVDVALSPGTYTLFCPVMDADNHRQRGMQTTITVQ